jgi:hypothetical protein
MQKNEQWVSDYLTAKSPEALKLKMLSNNIRRAAYHEYRIVHDGKDWFAWFEVPADEILLKEYGRLNEIKSKG